VLLTCDEGTQKKEGVSYEPSATIPSSASTLSQHQANDHRAYQERQRPGNPLEQRREFLWRERVKLEMQVQALLEHRKADVEQERPKLAAQIVLSGFV
jgi:hypothetical protein